jgi:hypothetical protein
MWPVKLAWFTQSNEVVVVDSPDLLHEFAAATDGPGVLWWIPDRHEPSLMEGCGRLEFLRRHGVSPYAFTPQHPQSRLSIERVWLDNRSSTPISTAVTRSLVRSSSAWIRPTSSTASARC